MKPVETDVHLDTAHQDRAAETRDGEKVSERKQGVTPQGALPAAAGARRNANASPLPRLTVNASLDLRTQISAPSRTAARDKGWHRDFLRQRKTAHNLSEGLTERTLRRSKLNPDEGRRGKRGRQQRN